MQLKWIDKIITDEGDRLHLHYLIDGDSDRCYGTICEPSGGDILYGTNLTFPAPDHLYVSLQAAKEYSEAMAEIHDEMEMEELMDDAEEYICDACIEAAEEQERKSHSHHKN